MNWAIANVKQADPDPSRLSQAEGEAHLWRARLDGGELSIDEANRVLSGDERARARRFRRAVDARRYMTARFVLRSLVGAYLDIEPQAVCFAYGVHDKPRVFPVCGNTLWFSVAHSGDVALYAFARDGQVGVDLERVRADLAALEIARRFFAQEEFHTLCAMPADQRVKAFHRCWTRKEAYLKAKGIGLSAALDAFAVSLDPSQPAALLWSRLEPGDVGRWSFIDVDVLPGYTAALVVEGTSPVCEVRVWN